MILSKRIEAPTMAPGFQPGQARAEEEPPLKSFTCTDLRD